MAGTAEQPVDEHRRKHGFRTYAEMAQLAETNTVFDLGSTMIAKNARIGSGNVFYPGVIVRCDGGSCDIGRDNVFFPSTVLLAEAGGRIVIGNGCTFGPGGVQVKANRPGVALLVGDRVRVLNGAEVVGSSTLGTGSQIIGAVSAQNVRLGSGHDFEGPDPDTRGAVLKGFGLAREIRLGAGDVVNGAGDFSTAPVERQLAYHPRAVD
uniref:Acyltransferase n=1 Tax=Streptomyces sp. NBC_00049 TaxID=2903617 RepID=A0AAU2K346_9ACTN